MIEIVPNWHPFVVHFTIGLLMVAVMLFVIARLLPWLSFTAGMTQTARWDLWLGTAFALLSILTGWQAYETVIHDTAGHEAMQVHRLWALITTGLFLLASILSVFELHRHKGGSIPLLLLLLMGFASLSMTGYLGAKNVYVHGLGVERLPDPEDHYHHDENASPHDNGAADGHKHDHEDSHEHDHHHGGHDRDEKTEPGDEHEHSH